MPCLVRLDSNGADVRQLRVQIRQSLFQDNPVTRVLCRFEFPHDARARQKNRFLFADEFQAIWRRYIVLCGAVAMVLSSVDLRRDRLAFPTSGHTPILRAPGPKLPLRRRTQRNTRRRDALLFVLCGAAARRGTRSGMLTRMPRRLQGRAGAASVASAPRRTATAIQPCRGRAGK